MQVAFTPTFVYNLRSVMAPAVAILCQRLLLPRCRCCCCPHLYGRSVVMSQCMKTICLPLMKVLCGLWESSGGPSRRSDHVAAAALMPYVGCSRLWMCAPWSVLSTYDLFAVFVSLHVICGELTVIPVPEVYLGHSISLFDCYSGPSPRPECLSRVSDLSNCNPFESSALWM